MWKGEKKKGGKKKKKNKTKKTKKKEEIKKTRSEFIKLYPEIPTYLTYETPYYRICVGNFRTKNEALKLNNFIRKNYIEAYPVKKIIKISELRN